MLNISSGTKLIYPIETSIVGFKYNAYTKQVF